MKSDDGGVLIDHPGDTDDDWESEEEKPEFAFLGSFFETTVFASLAEETIGLRRSWDHLVHGALTDHGKRDGRNQEVHSENDYEKSWTPEAIKLIWDHKQEDKDQISTKDNSVKLYSSF